MFDFDIPHFSFRADGAFREVAGLMLAPITKHKTRDSAARGLLAAPALNTEPVRAHEVDGHWISEPRGAFQASFHIAYFQGLGDFGEDDERFGWNCAKGVFKGERMVVAGGIARKIAPNPGPRRNARTAQQLLEFSKQLPDKTRGQLENSVGMPKGRLAQMQMAARAVASPIGWYALVFKQIASPGGGDPLLVPDFEAILPGVIKAADAVLPQTERLLYERGAADGRMGLFAFSLGVALAIRAATRPGPKKYAHAVLASASHIHTANMPELDSSGIGFDVVIPRDDGVMEAIGRSADVMKADLKKLSNDAWLWGQCPGGHALSGEAAMLAGNLLVDGLREKRRAPQSVSPAPAFVPA